MASVIADSCPIHPKKLNRDLNTMLFFDVRFEVFTAVTVKSAVF
jgi:hypothetical protein